MIGERGIRDNATRAEGHTLATLERAGIAVEVAAGRDVTCRPHRNSGEQGSGEVMPDLATADTDASRYDAIMFSGGWGSSMVSRSRVKTTIRRAFSARRWRDY